MSSGGRPLVFRAYALTDGVASARLGCTPGTCQSLASSFWEGASLWKRTEVLGGSFQPISVGANLNHEGLCTARSPESPSEASVQSGDVRHGELYNRTCGSQSGVPGPAAGVAPGAWLERRILAHPTPAGETHSPCGSKPPNGSPGKLRLANH